MATDMPGLKCILLTSILSLNCIVTIASGPLEDGIAAFRGCDHATAIQLLRQFAQRGNPSAQFYLGFMYANARGVPKNYGKALVRGEAIPFQSLCRTSELRRGAE